MGGKYAPLQHYLEALPEDQAEVVLAFGQIERLLNGKLPPSAHEHRQWWENEEAGMHVHARAWMDAGWRVVDVDQDRCVVRFVRR